jgi:hypothetical protein
MVPPIIGRSLVTANLWVRAHCSGNAASAVTYLEAKRAKDCCKEGVVFHASAPTTLLNDLDIEVWDLESNRFMGGIMEFEILKGDVTGVVSDESFQKRKTVLFGCSQSLV